MSRPLKCRNVARSPEVSYFKPAGIPLAQLEEVVLTVDEYEAIRLARLEDLYQEEAARKMNISRQTFGNILNTAYRKIADSIVNGKSLKIEGGVYRMEENRIFHCSDCHHEWRVGFGTDRPSACPDCGSKNIHRVPSERGYDRHNRSGLGGGRRRSS